MPRGTMFYLPHVARHMQRSAASAERHMTHATFHILKQTDSMIWWTAARSSQSDNLFTIEMLLEFQANTAINKTGYVTN